MHLKSLQLLWAISLFEAQRFRAFPTEAVATVIRRLLEMLLLITFWLIIGVHSESADIVPRDIISYYLIASGIVPFFYSGFGIASQMLKIIKSGELNQVLMKPINPILYPWAIRTGRNFVNLTLGFIQAVIGIFISGGLSLDVLPLFVPVMLNALIINGAFNIMIATLGFYLTEANGPKNAFLHVARLARGELIPLHLMPLSVANFLQYTPFPATQYHVTILLQGGRSLEWQSVAIGSTWAVALLALALQLWKHGLGKYEAIGI